MVEECWLDYKDPVKIISVIQNLHKRQADVLFIIGAAIRARLEPEGIPQFNLDSG